MIKNDLISRSRAIENIWDVFNSYANDSQRFDEYETKAINNAFKVLQKQIENQPIAYDVEKVLEELEYSQKVFNLNGEKPIQSIDYEDAINIVRNGGNGVKWKPL